MIPEKALKELDAAGRPPRERGLAIAWRMLDRARSKLAGAYPIPPFKRYREGLEIFDARITS